MKVIGLSGAQGGGKSSLLLALKTRGYRLDDFRVSRAVQAQLGWDSLDRVLESPETMVEFQEEVFKQKYKNDLGLCKDTSSDPKEVILTERTFVDIAAYTAHWSWGFVNSGKWTDGEAMNFLTSYHGKCVQAQLECYHALLLLPLMDHVIFEADPHRAKQSTAKLIMEDMERFVELRLPLNSLVLKITEKSIEGRADQVQRFISSNS